MGDAQFQSISLSHGSLPSCFRHPVRHLSFNSHSLITANVPYERVVRNTDLDNFTTHRRSAGWGCRGSGQTIVVRLWEEDPARVLSQARLLSQQLRAHVAVRQCMCCEASPRIAHGVGHPGAGMEAPTTAVAEPPVQVAKPRPRAQSGPRSPPPSWVFRDVSWPSLMLTLSTYHPTAGLPAHCPLLLTCLESDGPWAEGTRVLPEARARVGCTPGVGPGSAVLTRSLSVCFL